MSTRSVISLKWSHLPFIATAFEQAVSAALVVDDAVEGLVGADLLIDALPLLGLGLDDLGLGLEEGLAPSDPEGLLKLVCAAGRLDRVVLEGLKWVVLKELAEGLPERCARLDVGVLLAQGRPQALDDLLAAWRRDPLQPVSYTHLTLPTICSV
eukprot:14762651-Alexandrium_andersonii.AAC.2